MRQRKKLACASIMAQGARQAKTVPSLVRNSPLLSLVPVRRDVIIGGGVRAVR
jgi:hypothetical protein